MGRWLKSTRAPYSSRACGCNLVHLVAWKDKTWLVIPAWVISASIRQQWHHSNNTTTIGHSTPATTWTSGTIRDQVRATIVKGRATYERDYEALFLTTSAMPRYIQGGERSMTNNISNGGIDSATHRVSRLHWIATCTYTITTRQAKNSNGTHNNSNGDWCAKCSI